MTLRGQHRFSIILARGEARALACGVEIGRARCGVQMKDRALALVDMLKSASGGALLASGAMADAVAKAFPFTAAEDSAIGEVVASAT